MFLCDVTPFDATIDSISPVMRENVTVPTVPMAVSSSTMSGSPDQRMQESQFKPIRLQAAGPDKDGVLAKMEQFFTRLLKAVEGAEAKNAQPGQPAETKPGAGAPTDEEAIEAEAVEKIAKALEGIPALTEAVARLDGRLLNAFAVSTAS